MTTRDGKGRGDGPKRPGRAASRADFFPRLVAMQRLAQARNFVVFKMSNAGLPGRRKLTVILDNFSSDGEVSAKSVQDAYGDHLLEHIETSLLPILWDGVEDSQTAEMADFSGFVRKLRPRHLSVCGLALPIRLGGMGNGYIVFVGNYLDLTNDVLVDLHDRGHQIMMDLLVLDERSNAPDEVLSGREVACLQLAGDGLVSEEVAERLKLSVHTVNAYLASATLKLDSVNRIQAIAKAIRLGYIA